MNDPYKILGVSESATDAEVKKAYLDLARKYHPDNYHDNPLADLAQEKMKEINAAYEEINRMRGIGRGGGSTAGRAGSGYGYGDGYGGTAQQTWNSQSGSSVLQQIRIAINTGNLTRAEGLLAGYADHNAEWNFLKGAVSYRRGWLDDALRYYQTACQMDPGNPEYRQALEFMENAGTTAYSPGGAFGTDVCSEDSLCQKLCCAWLLCNGCGFLGFRC